jgi:hypothetical protein
VQTAMAGVTPDRAAAVGMGKLTEPGSSSD